MSGWGLGVGALESAGCALAGFGRCEDCRGIRLALGERGRVCCPSREEGTNAVVASVAFYYMFPCT